MVSVAWLEPENQDQSAKSHFFFFWKFDTNVMQFSGVITGRPVDA